jgi:hypothetical protein
VLPAGRIAIHSEQECFQKNDVVFSPAAHFGRKDECLIQQCFGDNRADPFERVSARDFRDVSPQKRRAGKSVVESEMLKRSSACSYRRIVYPRSLNRWRGCGSCCAPSANSRFSTASNFRHVPDSDGDVQIDGSFDLPGGRKRSEG